jgi:ABC-type uncharacterized transport system permease subunit
VLLHLTFGLTALLYIAAAALYASFLQRGVERVARGAASFLGGAILAHVAFLVVVYSTQGQTPTRDIHQTLAVTSLMVVLLFLVTTRFRRRLRVLGAFITPVTLLLFLGAAFRVHVGPVPDEVRWTLLPLHIAVNVVGLASFALASAAGAAYILQERQLKQKRLGGLFQRLPSLDVLDNVGLRAVLVGFPLFTVGVITGTVWAVQQSPAAPVLTPAQGFGVIAWLLFAAVLLMRVAVGWRGRRAAYGTMLGFVAMLVTLLSYTFRIGT